MVNSDVQLHVNIYKIGMSILLIQGKLSKTNAIETTLSS